MQSALEIVAFTQGSRSKGIAALLQVALRALDEEGMPGIAVHVDLALALLKSDCAAPDEMPRLSTRFDKKSKLTH